MRTYIKDCRRGRFLLLQGDMVSQYADVYGEWCEQEAKLFERIVKPDHNVIEVGSHIGLHAIPLARMATQGKVFCFEPQRILFQMLCANAALNNCVNLYAHNRAVGNRKGWIEVSTTDYSARWNYGSFSVERGFSTEGQFRGPQSSESIEICALDADPAIEALGAVRLIKIDVEGFEMQVLEGSHRLIEKHKPVLFVENNKEDRGDDLIAAIRLLGYECFWFCAERFSPHNYNQVTWKLPGMDANMVCFAVAENANAYGLPKVKSFADLRSGLVPLVRG
jgi:FkbM family methyltransferase